MDLNIVSHFVQFALSVEWDRDWGLTIQALAQDQKNLVETGLQPCWFKSSRSTKVTLSETFRIY